MNRLGIGVFGALLLLPSAANAGILFETRTYDFQTGELETSLGYTHQGRVKLGLSQSTVATDQGGGYRARHQPTTRRVIINEGTEVIFRPGHSNRLAELILVDHGNRSYRVINERSVPRHRSDSGPNYNNQGQIDIFGIFAEALQNAGQDDRNDGGPDYRDRRDDDYRRNDDYRRRDRNVTVRQTRRREESWFGPCAVWERIRRGVRTHEVCVVDPNRVQYGTAILSDTQHLAEFYDDIVGRLGRETRGMVFGFVGVNGFPVVTRTFDRNGQVLTEREFIRAREVRLNRQNFLPPRNYRYDDGRAR